MWAWIIGAHRPLPAFSSSSPTPVWVMHFRYELLPKIYTLVNVEPLLQGRLDLNPSLSLGCGSLTAVDITELKASGVRRAQEIHMCVCEEQGRKKETQNFGGCISATITIMFHRGRYKFLVNNLFFRDRMTELVFPPFLNRNRFQV